MTYRTHVVGAATAALAVASRQPWPALAVVLLTAMLTAPLPDLDHPGSTYGRHVPLPPVAREHGRVVPYTPHGSHFGQVGFRVPGGILWHRGPLHSIVVGAGLVVAIGTLPVIGAPWVALGVACGWGSHLLLDGFNVAGQAWFWPLTRRRFRLPGVHLRVGSFGETLVLVMCLATLVLIGHALVAGGVRV